MTDSISAETPSFVESLIGSLINSLKGDEDPLAGSIMLEETSPIADVVESAALQFDDMVPLKGLLGLALMGGIKPIASQGIKAYLPKVVKEAQKRIVPAIVKAPTAEAVTTTWTPEVLEILKQLNGK